MNALDMKTGKRFSSICARVGKGKRYSAQICGRCGYEFGGKDLEHLPSPGGVCSLIGCTNAAEWRYDFQAVEVYSQGGE